LPARREGSLTPRLLVIRSSVENAGGLWCRCPTARSALGLWRAPSLERQEHDVSRRVPA